MHHTTLVERNIIVQCVEVSNGADTLNDDWAGWLERPSRRRVSLHNRPTIHKDDGVCRSHCLWREVDFGDQVKRVNARDADQSSLGCACHTFLVEATGFMTIKVTNSLTIQYQLRVVHERRSLRSFLFC